MSEQLKRCPFCGGKPTLTHGYKKDNHRFGLVFCQCGASVKSEDCWNYIEAELKAIEAWNRREG